MVMHVLQGLTPLSWSKELNMAEHEKKESKAAERKEEAKKEAKKGGKRFGGRHSSRK